MNQPHIDELLDELYQTGMIVQKFREETQTFEMISYEEYTKYELIDDMDLINTDDL